MGGAAPDPVPGFRKRMILKAFSLADNAGGGRFRTILGIDLGFIFARLQDVMLGLMLGYQNAQNALKSMF